jgi:hypothetical protein
VRGLLSLGSVDDRGDRAQDLPRGRMLEAEVREAGEATAQIPVEGDFDRWRALGRVDDHEVLERLTAVRAKQSLGNLARVLGVVLFGSVRQAEPSPVLLGWCAVLLCTEGSELDERRWPAPEQPRHLAASQRDTPLSRCAQAGQRLEPREAVDYGQRSNASGERYGGGLRPVSRGKQGDTPRSISERRLGAEYLAHSSDVRVEGLPLRPRRERRKLMLALRDGRGVEVEVDAQHGTTIGLELREAPQRPDSDRGWDHHTPLPSPWNANRIGVLETIFVTSASAVHEPPKQRMA